MLHEGHHHERELCHPSSQLAYCYLMPCENPLRSNIHGTISSENLSAQLLASWLSDSCAPSQLLHNLGHQFHQYPQSGMKGM